MSRLSQSEVETVRAGARRIWQGEWNRRILLLVVFYATVELILLAVFDTGTWDTPLLFAYLAVVSAAMVVSHQRWFARVEADLARGETETFTGTVRYPSTIEKTLLPAMRHGIFIGEERLVLGPDAESRPDAGSQRAVEALPSTRIIIKVDSSEG